MKTDIMTLFDSMLKSNNEDMQAPLIYLLLKLAGYGAHLPSVRCFG